MTMWDVAVHEMSVMLEAGELRICVGFCVEKLGDKELECVSQLFPHAKEIGIVARSDDDREHGAKAIQRAACTDARWEIVHMVSGDEEFPFPVHRWHVYWDGWLEGRY